MLVHATSVALRTGRVWRAVLLRGAPGSGKSDLALRLIDAGARLIADDQTRLVRKGRAVVASAPQSLKSLMEVRGVGIVKLKPGQILAAAPVGLIVDLVAATAIERLPEAAREALLGIEIKQLALAPFEASAPAKLRMALQ
jgi:HPr kinase/phosphorylase